MKRLFNPRKRSEGEPVGEQANTLDRIVKDKEGIRRRLEEEEKEFLGKKREAERKMIEFEKQVAIPFKILNILALSRVAKYADLESSLFTISCISDSHQTHSTGDFVQ